jgi:hypothetical protein
MSVQPHFIKTTFAISPFENRKRNLHNPFASRA